MNDKGQATRELLENTRQGSLGLDQTASLTGKSSDDGLRFSFEYSGFLFAVRAAAGQQNTSIRFHANLGNMPYTAENPYARRHAMAVLRSAGRALGGRVVLTPEQRILLHESLVIDEPFTPVMLMSRTAKLLVMAKPYLELLSRFVTPPVVN